MNIQGKHFQIGADPEIFLGKDGRFVSAHDKLPGDKLNPHRVEKGAVQVDGLAAEFNIDPADSFEEFEENLNSVQTTLLGMIGEHEFLQDSSVFFDEEFIKDIPAFNLALGCMSDFDAWSMQENQPPDQTKLMRTTGGHVHIGGIHADNPHKMKHITKTGRLARILDETVGVYSLLWDDDDERRAMYGKAGCFRPKEYGMEYRTLSNRWIFSPTTVKFVFDGVVEAIDAWLGGYEPDPAIADIINTSNRNSPFFTDNIKAKLLRG